MYSVQMVFRWTPGLSPDRSRRVVFLDKTYLLVPHSIHEYTIKLRK